MCLKCFRRYYSQMIYTLSTRSLHYNSLIALINRELLGISGWMETTKLSLNVGKTIMMLMSNRQHGGHFDDGGVLLNWEEICFASLGTFWECVLI